MSDKKHTFVLPSNVNSNNYGKNPPPPTNQARPAPPPPPPSKDKK